MSNPFKTISIALILFLALNSCEKDCASPKGIYGDWVFDRSYINGITTTPETTGYTEKLSINYYTFKQYFNDSLVFESQYDLQIRTDSLGNESTFIVFASGFEEGIHVGETEMAIIHHWIFQQPAVTYYTRD